MAARLVEADTEVLEEGTPAGRRRARRLRAILTAKIMLEWSTPPIAAAAAVAARRSHILDRTPATLQAADRNKMNYLRQCRGPSDVHRQCARLIERVQSASPWRRTGHSSTAKAD
jgi:hypothetical protein